MKRKEAQELYMKPGEMLLHERNNGFPIMRCVDTGLHKRLIDEKWHRVNSFDTPFSTDPNLANGWSRYVEPVRPVGQEAPLQIREGAWYRQRNGKVVGPASRNTRDTKNRYPWRIDNIAHTDTGCDLSSGNSSPLDLMAEVPPPQQWVDVVPEWRRGILYLDHNNGYYFVVEAPGFRDFMGFVWGDELSTEWFRIIGGKVVYCDAVRFRKEQS